MTVMKLQALNDWQGKVTEVKLQVHKWLMIARTDRDEMTGLKWFTALYVTDWDEGLMIAGNDRPVNDWQR